MSRQMLRRATMLAFSGALAALTACDVSIPGLSTPVPAGPPPVATPTALPADAQGMSWIFSGLAGQSMRAVGGSSQTDAPIYAGGPGLYETTDRGATWTALSLPDGTQVDDIEVSPANPQVIYAGAGAPCDQGGSGGQFRSTDGGATWQPLGRPAPASLQVSAQDPDVVFGMGCRGLVRSTDGGQQWTLRADADMQGQPDLHPGRVRLPANPIGPIYASWLRADGSGRIRITYNQGANWAGDATFFSGLTDLLVDDKRPSFAWVLSQSGLVRTTDNGTHWVVTTTGLDAARSVHQGVIGPYQLAALTAQYTDAGDMDELYVGTFATPQRPAAGAFSSGDLGKVWGRFGGDLGGRDIRSIYVAREKAADGGRDHVLLYAATDNGVFKILLGTSR